MEPKRLSLLRDLVPQAAVFAVQLCPRAQPLSRPDQLRYNDAPAAPAGPRRGLRIGFRWFRRSARLQALAEPNTVVIAESTRKLLGNLFELQDLGAKVVKGIAEPVRAWAVLRPSSVEGRFEALHATGLTALVGRERFGGFVAKYMGDGVLYFGYPQAHEDNAERAVRAGLELVGAVNALKTGASLQTRVGIATGLVVVGDLIGSGEAQERGIVGETPNVAAAPSRRHTSDRRK